MCRVSSSERANFQPQPSHVHLYGFSPGVKISAQLRMRKYYLYVYASVPLNVMIWCRFCRMRDIRTDESYSFVFRVFYVFVSVIGLVDVRDETMRPVVHCVEVDHEELVRDDRVDRRL